MRHNSVSHTSLRCFQHVSRSVCIVHIDWHAVQGCITATYQTDSRPQLNLRTASSTVSKPSLRGVSVDTHSLFLADLSEALQLLLPHGLGLLALLDLQLHLHLHLQDIGCPGERREAPSGTTPSPNHIRRTRYRNHRRSFTHARLFNCVK